MFENIKDVQLIQKQIDNNFIVQNNIQSLVDNKKHNLIYQYLNEIIKFNYPIDKLNEIMLASFNYDKKQETNKNYIIFLNSELMEEYTKNLEFLKTNLLSDNYSIPTSQTNTSSRNIKRGYEQNYNKINYNYDINLSNSSQNTNVKIESFISDKKKQQIINKIINNFKYINGEDIFEKVIKNDCRKIASTILSRVNDIIKCKQFKDDDLFNNFTNSVQSIGGKNNQKNFDKNWLIEKLSHTKYNSDDIEFLLELFFNTNKIGQETINYFELCYNIILFNLIIENDKYNKIKDVMDNSVQKYNIAEIKIYDLYFLKVFNNKNIIENIYFNENKKLIQNIKNNKIKIDSIQCLTNNLDDILDKFGPFSISYKIIEFLLEEFFKNANKKSEDVSNYLDGFSLEYYIKNIITMDNNKIIRLPNLYYIINTDLNFVEFDLICLVKNNEKLVLNKGIFDRVSNINNLKLLDNVENINELSLIFFEIKNSQRTPGKIIENLIDKANFLYPLFEKYLFNKYKIQINDYKLYFVYIFDSKFNAYQFGIPKISDIKKKVNLNNIKNNKNDIKIIYIHAETNVGQYNAQGLKNEINNLNKAIEAQEKKYQENLNKAIKSQEKKYQENLNKAIKDQEKKYQENLNNQEKKYQEILNNQEKKHQENLNNQEKKHQENLNNQEKKYQENLNNQEKKYQENLSNQEKKHQENLNKAIEVQAKKFQEMLDEKMMELQKQIQEEKKSREELNKQYEEMKIKYQGQINIKTQMKKQNKIFEEKKNNNTKNNKLLQDYYEGNNNINSSSLRRTKSLDSRKNK